MNTEQRTEQRIAYRPRNAGKAADVSTATIYRAVREGQLELVHLAPNVSVIPAASLYAWLERRREASRALVEQRSAAARALVHKRKARPTKGEAEAAAHE